jgi:hypothetical protein
MGFDFRKSFAQMNENSYLSYWVWVEIMKLDSIKIKKATKKIEGREGQSPFDEM